MLFGVFFVIIKSINGVAILLMTYVITEDLNLSIFKLITGINQKHLTEHISQNLNVNLMLESAIQIKIGITINVVSVKFLKNIIIFVILQKMANI